MINQNGGFDHLPLIFRTIGRARLTGRGKVSDKTKEHKLHRKAHSDNLIKSTKSLTGFWQELRSSRGDELPPLPKGIPILLEIDPNMDPDFLLSFGFEIVSEQENGFVIVSSEDINLSEFQKRVNDFINEVRGSTNIASIHKLHEDINFEKRLENLLCDILLKNWHEIQDEHQYTVDVGIECLGNITLSDPTKRKDETEEKYQIRLQKWYKERNAAYEAWDAIKMEREKSIERFVAAYSGQVLSIIDGENLGPSELPDSFTARIKISGKGLRDFAYNYPYVFEIVTPDDVSWSPSETHDMYHVEMPDRIIQPDKNDPKVCVIDSGIQEEHVLMAQAIDSDNSHCYLTGCTDISDHVEEGGHGTCVAGAVLYPRAIPKSGSSKLHCWIQNARVLNEDNKMPIELFPPNLIRSIVSRYYGKLGTRIFNHSITGSVSSRLRHMSAWATEIDKLSFENDILVIQAAGNVYTSSSNPFSLGIIEHLSAGRNYPDYLLENSCRISNPAQSMQALTVGSIGSVSYEDTGHKSFGYKDWPSAFSRTGLAIWDIIKPDVVEYGGNFVRDTGEPPNITYPQEVCPELVRTSPPGPAYASDKVGTSFATPKIAHIASALEKILPGEPCLLYRALIAQSARWPEWAFMKPAEEYDKIIRHIGYGLPDNERATTNNPHRVTLITHGRVSIKAREAHIYQVPIPDSLRAQGESHDILIEVTLSYAAKPRRTRRQLRKYLSTWVEWKTSNINEDPKSFAHRVLLEGNKDESHYDGSIPWTISFRKDIGLVKGVRRNSGTLQKDWAIIKSYELPVGFFGIAVVGRPGWDKDPEAKAVYSLTVSLEAINSDIDIYEPIRSLIEVEMEQIEQAREIEVEMEVDMQ